MDREWPHQVALPAYRCNGGNYITIRLFCDEHRLSLCTRTHSFRHDDYDVIVFCFAERAHAEQFRAQFGGDFLDPKDRSKWPGTKLDRAQCFYSSRIFAACNAATRCRAAQESDVFGVRPNPKSRSSSISRSHARTRLFAASSGP